MPLKLTIRESWHGLTDSAIFELENGIFHHGAAAVRFTRQRKKARQVKIEEERKKANILDFSYLYYDSNLFNASLFKFSRWPYYTISYEYGKQGERTTENRIARLSSPTFAFRS